MTLPRTPSAPHVLVAALALLLVPAAHAQDDVIAPSPGMNGLPNDAGADGKTNWGIGIGLGVSRKPYTGYETKTRAMPLVFFENQYVRVLGLGGDIKLPSAGPVSLALRLRYAPEGYEASDAPILNGMADRKGGLLAGAGAALRTPYGLVTAEALGDVSGHSKGTQAKLGFASPMRFGAFSVTPQIAALWLDGKTVDYNYGVRASEVRLGRAQYTGSSTVNTEIGVRTGYALARDQTLTLDVGSTLFGSGIKASPLVDRSSQTSVRVGYIFRF